MSIGPLSFGEPVWIYAALVCGALGVAAFAARAAAPAFGRRSPVRAPFILRAIALGLLCVVLARPFTTEQGETLRVNALLDVSDSVDSEVGGQFLNLVEEWRRGGVEVEVVPFAGSAGALPIAPASGGSYDTVRESWSKLNRGATDLEAALRTAAARGGARQVLLTDGYETAGDSRRMMSTISNAGIALYPVTLNRAQDLVHRFRISQLNVPLTAPEMSSVDIRVSIENTFDTEKRGILEIKHGAKVLESREVRVPAGSEIVVQTESDSSQGGVHEVTAALKPLDAGMPPSTEKSYLSGETREKVLLVSGSFEDERALKEVLEQQSYKLEAKIPSRDGELSAEFGEFATVIFNNVSLVQVGRGSADRVREYVKQGGGFVMIGGNRSFGLGGYEGSAIEEVLPLELVPPQREEKRLNVAVMLLLDKSRSMASDNRMDFAKEAARALISNLKDDDYVGVIGFDSTPFIVVRLSQLASARQMALDRIARIFPTGATNPLPAYDEARRSLMRVNAGRKHVILLTDGQIPDASPAYTELAKQMRLLGMTTSTVLVGSDDGAVFLRSIAEYGGGAFYQTQDARALPKIFIQDVKVRSGEQTLKEEREYPVRKGPAGLSSTAIENFPAVSGYVQTRAKDRAQLELVVQTDDRAEPLLASWKFGQGKAAGFTSDANGRWSRDWVRWGKFWQFWNNIVESVKSERGGEKSEKVRFDLRTYMEGGVLVLDLAVFSADAAGAVEAVVTTPSGEERRVTFQEVSRGRYRGELAAPLAGRYDVAGKVGARKLTPVAFALSGELFGERRGRGFNLANLESLAQQTGGRLNPTLDDFRSDALKDIKRIDRSVMFLAGAFALLILEIILREIYRPRRARVAPRRTVARAA